MQDHPLPSVALIVILWFALLAGAYFLWTLQAVLKKCAPASRTMEPGKIWLELIPIFGLGWQFVNVTRIASSLSNEFTRLGVSNPEPAPGKSLGLAMCICNCCMLIPLPLVRDLAALCGLLLWIAYWNRISGYSEFLDAHQSVTSASPIP